MVHHWILVDVDYMGLSENGDFYGLHLEMGRNMMTMTIGFWGYPFNQTQIMLVV